MTNNKPNIVHPTIPGAVGSINSPYLEGRDKEKEAKLIIDDMIELLNKPETAREKADVKPAGGKTRPRKK